MATAGQVHPMERVLNPLVPRSQRDLHPVDELRLGITKEPPSCHDRQKVFQEVM